MSGYAAGASALLAIAGSATSAYANNQALNRQDRVAADSIRQQAANRDQADQVVQKTVKNTATDEKQNLQANKQKQQTAYLDALRRAAPTQDTSTPAVAGASRAYADAAASATKDNAQFGRTLADQTSTVDAPQLTQMGTSLQLGDAATQLGLVNDTSNRQANIAKLKAQAITANPWLLGASGLLSGASTAVGSRAGAGGTTKKPSGAGVYADNGLSGGLSGMNA